jgi:hypothetical protein
MTRESLDAQIDAQIDRVGERMTVVRADAGLTAAVRQRLQPARSWTWVVAPACAAAAAILIAVVAISEQFSFAGGSARSESHPIAATRPSPSESLAVDGSAVVPSHVAELPGAPIAERTAEPLRSKSEQRLVITPADAPSLEIAALEITPVEIEYIGFADLEIAEHKEPQ